MCLLGGARVGVRKNTGLTPGIGAKIYSEKNSVRMWQLSNRQEWEGYSGVVFCRQKQSIFTICRGVCLQILSEIDKRNCLVKCLRWWFVFCSICCLSCLLWKVKVSLFSSLYIVTCVLQLLMQNSWHSISKQNTTHTKRESTAQGANKQPLNYQPLSTPLNTSCFSVNDWIKALIKMHLTHKQQLPFTYHWKAN